MPTDSTAAARPTPNRPAYGLLAWQATIGYICSEYSPDAVLTVIAAPQRDVILWQASASWGRINEQVDRQPSFPSALTSLWREVDRHHTIFKTLEASAKRPVNYAENQWIDPDTDRSLTRLIQSASSAFGTDWRLVLHYQPVESPAARVQARLIARADRINVGGRGAGLLAACRTLFRNAAHEFTA